MEAYAWLIPVFPAIAVVINGLLGRKLIRERAHYIAVGSVAISLILSTAVFWQVAVHHEQANFVLFEWIGPVGGNAGFLIDPLSAIMLMVVCGVGFLVHVYSIGYMHGEDGYSRYFSYLNLFMVSMIILVMANNYLLMFVGWEGVGLCSYLLIGFWYHKKSASDAGKKAFVVNRIGDAGFLMGMFFIFKYFGTLDYEAVFHNAHHLTATAATVITMCLFVGAMGKSAQIPLYVWLPDAMEGPTPVSALIHAATMVTAGVYMVVRSNVLYLMAPASMELVATVGAVTAIFAASIGLVQNDIKRVLAYSTVSQLGYMFLGCGVGAFAASIFHLMTHAFFKGLLFLASGSVIHALSGEQDMRFMGALRPHIPKTAITFYVGALAISGIPPFAGFWSKDEILGEAFKSGHYFHWALGFIAAFMTAFYMFRLIYMTFYGKSRVTPEAARHIHESPGSMTVPLIILAFLSVVGGILPGFPPEGGWIHGFLSSVAGGHHAVEGVSEMGHNAPGFHLWGLSGLDFILMFLSVLVGVAGWVLARYMYTVNTSVPERLAERFDGMYRLLLNKYWVDEIYDAVIVNPIKRCMNFLWNFDAWVIDGIVNGVSWLTVLKSKFSGTIDRYAVDGAVNGIAEIIMSGGSIFRRIQTGYIQNYALIMIVGIFVIIYYVVL